MAFVRMLKELARGQARSQPSAVEGSAPCVLNVGGNSKAIAIPAHYDGWTHLLLDIDPEVKPDVLHDARKLTELPPAQFDAIYCSHNLEHYYRHDGSRVLAGFRHVLKPDGFAEIRVPDVRAVMQRCVAGNMDVDDLLYDSPAGPMKVHDVLYGWGKQIEESGQDFFAHKAGFTAKSLAKFLLDAGFGQVLIVERPDIYEIGALAFMQQAPTPQQRNLLNLD
jgi:predicted SAM-dependent methyltransferase